MNLRKEFLYGLTIPSLFLSTGLMASDSSKASFEDVLKDGVAALLTRAATASTVPHSSASAAPKKTKCKQTSDSSNSDAEDDLDLSASWTGGAQEPKEKGKESGATVGIPVIDDISSNDEKDDAEKQLSASDSDEDVKSKSGKGRYLRKKSRGKNLLSDIKDTWDKLDRFVNSAVGSASSVAPLPVPLISQTASPSVNHRKISTLELLSKLSIIAEQNSVMSAQLAEVITLFKEQQKSNVAK